jgi:hypothetical protein
MKKKLSKQQQIKQEEGYIAFLQKRLASNNFKSNVSEEEFGKTKAKYEKAKLKLRLLQGKL